MTDPLTSKQEVSFPCGHTVSHEEDCPRCVTERLTDDCAEWHEAAGEWEGRATAWGTAANERQQEIERLRRDATAEAAATCKIIDVMTQEISRLRAALERITECTEERDGGEGIQVIAGSGREFWCAVIAAKELTHGRPAAETDAGLNGWRSIDTVPAGEHLFWVVPKSAGEGYTDTNGNPILLTHAPYIHFGHHGTWSCLSKATHWMPAPVSPLNGEQL